MSEDLSQRTETRLLVESLRQSCDFREYEEAFRAATGLPLELTSADQVRFALCSKHDAGRTSFCSLMVREGHQCETCRRLHQSIEKEMGIAPEEGLSADGGCELGLTPKSPETVMELPERFGMNPRTFECFAGLAETLVPIQMGGRLVAFLQTGQVLVNPPTPEAFRKAARQITNLGENQDFEALEKAYFDTPVVPPERYRAMVQLLKTYASHLSEISGKLLLELESREPTAVTHAKLFIKENYECPLTLEDVSCEVAVSPFHFSKVFKKATGLKFTDYLGRVRIEHAKELLLNRNKQISEIAYAVGYQSLAPFNRAFQKFEGMTPRDYRNVHAPR